MISVNMSETVCITFKALIKRLLLYITLAIFVPWTWFDFDFLSMEPDSRGISKGQHKYICQTLSDVLKGIGAGLVSFFIQWLKLHKIHFFLVQSLFLPMLCGPVVLSQFCLGHNDWGLISYEVLIQNPNRDCKDLRSVGLGHLATASISSGSVAMPPENTMSFWLTEMILVKCVSPSSTLSNIWIRCSSWFCSECPNR